jgi:hypothetical protein
LQEATELVLVLLVLLVMLMSETGSNKSKRNGEKEEFALMKLYSSNDTIQEVRRGELSKLS